MHQFGSLRALSRPRLNKTLDYLITQGYIRRNSTHGALGLSQRALDVLSSNIKVSIPVKTEDTPAVPQPESKSGAEKNAGSPLFDALKAARLSIAQEEGVPAYIVFSNASLRDMAKKAPRTPAQFRNVSGVGDVKAARYAEVFLRAIKEFAAPKQI